MIGKINSTNIITVLTKIQKDLEQVILFANDDPTYYTSYIKEAYDDVSLAIKYYNMDKNDEKRTG